MKLVPCKGHSADSWYGRKLFHLVGSSVKLDLGDKQLKPLENGFRDHLNFLLWMNPIFYYVTANPPSWCSTNDGEYHVSNPELKETERP